jgi:lysyl-tRNA synthetase class 2
MHLPLSSRLNNLRLRNRMMQSIRAFFRSRNFLEVETPCRIPAPAPEAHIDAVASEGWFLHTSPELCMKQLLAAGYPRIFQICRCFRNMERGERHLPEFTLLEWYEAETDYLDMMEQCEELIRFIAADIGRENRLTYQNQSVDLNRPWHRLSVHESFQRYTSTSPEKALETDQFDEIIAFKIEPELGFDKPVFLYDYPAECAALARKRPYNPAVAERFELYICGMELCNAFSELTDPVEQRRRFEEELTLRVQTGKTVYTMPEPFLNTLGKMPPASGSALGLDRLAMLLTDASCIDDVVAFTPETL